MSAKWTIIDQDETWEYWLDQFGNLWLFPNGFADLCLDQDENEKDENEKEVL